MNWAQYFLIMIAVIGLTGVLLSLLVGFIGEAGKLLYGENKRFFFQISFVLTLYIGMAFYQMGFQTHALAWLPLYLFGIWVLRKSRKQFIRKHGSIFKIVRPALFFLAFFIFNSFLFFDFSTGLPRPLYTDFYWFGQIVEQLLSGSRENFLIELTILVPEASQIDVPYHYSYLWITALFSKITGYSSTNALYLGTLPLLYTLVAEGLYEVMRARHSRVKSLIILLICLFLGPFDWYGLVEADMFSWANKTAPLGLFSGKVLLPLCLLLLYFIHSNHKYAITILAGLPLLSVLFLPPVAGCMFFYFLWQLFVKGKYKGQRTNLIVIASTLGSYLLFYFVSGFIGLPAETQTESQGNSILSPAYLITELKIQIGSYFAYRLKITPIVLFMLLVYTAPIITIALFYWRKQTLLFLGFTVFPFFTASFMYGKEINNDQFFTAFTTIFWAGAVLSIPKMSNKVLVFTLIVFTSMSVRTFYHFTKLNTQNAQHLRTTPADYARLNEELIGNKITAIFLVPPEDANFLFHSWRVKTDLLYLHHFNAAHWIWVLSNPEDFPYNDWDSVESGRKYRKKSIPTAHYFAEGNGTLSELVQMGVKNRIQNYYFQSQELYSPYENFVESQLSFKSIPFGSGIFISVENMNILKETP